MTKKQKNKTIEDKDETIIEMAPIIKEKYTKLFLIISLIKVGFPAPEGAEKIINFPLLFNILNLLSHFFN